MPHFAADDGATMSGMHLQSLRSPGGCHAGSCGVVQTRRPAWHASGPAHRHRAQQSTRYCGVARYAASQPAQEDRIAEAEAPEPLLDTRVTARNFRAGNYDKISRTVNEQVIPGIFWRISGVAAQCAQHHAS